MTFFGAVAGCGDFWNGNKMECVVCDKIKEKKAMIVYEDDNLIAILPSKPAVPGHVKVMPKQHVTQIDEMSEESVQDLFFLANFASSAVFDAAKAHGTNIILNESEGHLAIDVIPRKENDGINFTWKPKQLSPAEMDEMHNKITDKAFLVGNKEEPQPTIPVIENQKVEVKQEEAKDGKKGKINYLLKHLIKIP
jgi:diadenosine tetraphosphate (Ap4A) HIT family hydrolase